MIADFGMQIAEGFDYAGAGLPTVPSYEDTGGARERRGKEV